MAGKTVVNQVQLGDSATATQNFTLQTNVDGTAKLARGNAGATTQDILTVDAAGKVAFPQNVQTWQNMSGSRVSGTTYTNSTDQPISVSITSTSAIATIGFARVHVGGVTISYNYFPGIAGSATVTQAIAIVPAGATYVYTWQGTAVIMELR